MSIQKENHNRLDEDRTNSEHHTMEETELSDDDLEAVSGGWREWEEGSTSNADWVW